MCVSVNWSTFNAISHTFKLVVWTNRADVQREDEDDEEAQVPGEQRAEQYHALLLLKVSIPMQKEKSQKKDHHNLDAQRRPAHSVPLIPCCKATWETEEEKNRYKNLL